jgi:hypothetical protein
MDVDELQVFIFNALKQGTKVLSAQVEDLNNQVQALYQTSSGYQASASQTTNPGIRLGIVILMMMVRDNMMNRL